jgi:hypothetical protein
MGMQVFLVTLQVMDIHPSYSILLEMLLPDEGKEKMGIPFKVTVKEIKWCGWKLVLAERWIFLAVPRRRL